jgi:hypothetical protein
VPQYTIFGEKTMLSFKVIPPTLRCLRNGALVVDSNKKGRILLEWAPRNDGGECDMGLEFLGSSVDCIAVVIIGSSICNTGHIDILEMS